MANASKAKGTAWETETLAFARKCGLDAEKLPQLGNQDQGDSVIRTPGRGLRLVEEKKNRQTIALPRFLREAVDEAAVYAESRELPHNLEDDERQVYGYSVVKARGKNVREGYVVFRLEDWYDLVGRYL